MEQTLNYWFTSRTSGLIGQIAYLGNQSNKAKWARLIKILAFEIIFIH